MKKIIITIPMLLLACSLLSQKYFTRDGNIKFSSDAPMEKIEAINGKASSVIDAASGAIEWAVLIKAFEFKKALMQEHFNENYMESSKFPKATFKGKIKDISALNFNEDGDYEVSIDGSLTLHGVKKDISTTATFNVSKGIVSAESQLSVLVADYEIKIPGVVKDNIAKEVIINISADYQLFKKS